MILITLGMILTYEKNPSINPRWIGNKYNKGNYIIAYLNESPVLKAKTVKIEACVEGVIDQDSIFPCYGKILLYFKRDSFELKYGERILIRRDLDHIRNAGNPGGFDYRQYCAFRQIYYTAYLKPAEWSRLNGENKNFLTSFLITSRNNILDELKKAMVKDDQLSIAEALLIGYTDDLDRDLVKAYSNTGVVHIIAISGMHLGLIYIILLWVFNKLPYLRKLKVLKIIFILTGLWLFALLTGGCPSILRSAVMFTCIIIGKHFSKSPSIYNSLAASAFILLCYNPYFLWDVGFQLSYISLLGIIVFQKYIYRILYFKNKWIDKVWELSAVSIAAQVLTFPLCLYYFHQFPLLFLFTNLITVPLSTLILFVEIFFVSIGWIRIAGFYFGKVVWLLILFMNKTIQFFNQLPGSVISNISLSILSTILLYGFVAAIAYWLMDKNKSACKVSLYISVMFVLIQLRSSWICLHQRKLIVYNIAQHQAMDFIDGNRFSFVGDSVVEEDEMLQNYNLKPSRLAFSIFNPLSLPDPVNHIFLFNNKKILLVEPGTYFKALARKPLIDLVIISKNPDIGISSLTNTFGCRSVVLDASNPLWKIAQWKKECELLHLPCHTVSENGAFIMDL